MVDPLSIPALTIVVAGICLRVGEFFDTCRDADQTWQDFHHEIRALERVLRSISTTFRPADDVEKDTDSSSSAVKIVARIENQHHQDVETCLQDCQRTLERIEAILNHIKVDDSRMFARPLQQFKLDRKAGPLTILRNQIQSYTQALQLTLETINT